jgi:hypothetical protein
MSACASSFGERVVVDADDDLQDMMALAESAILGFTALIYMGQNHPLWLEHYIQGWAELAERLVLMQARPVSEHLLEAYFSFLEAIDTYTDSFGQVISMLNMVPISWGIASDDAELCSRGIALFDLTPQCPEAES